MNPVIQMLMAYSQRQANSSDVMRALVTYRGWFVPAGLFALSGEEKRRVDSVLVLSADNLVPADELWIFTDEASARLATDQGASVGTYAGGMAGTELFGLIDPGLQTVCVNPGSPLEQTWTFQQGSATSVGQLWASLITLEEKFREWSQTGKFDKAALLNHRGFLFFDHVSGPIVTLPNQGGMSTPAAAFTAPDCAQNFLNELSDEERRSIKQVEVDGYRLPGLSATGIDGFVFNLFGPGASYALRLDHLRE